MRLSNRSKRLKANRELENSHSDMVQKDRWLISYADLVTLLSVFFIALYAVTVLKNDEIQAPVINAESNNIVENSVLKVEPSIQALARNLATDMSVYMVDEGVSIDVTERGLEIAMRSGLLFRVGSAELAQSSEQVLSQLTRSLEGVDSEIWVEGYTDETPISTSNYPSNWELSSARASRIVRQLVTNGWSGDRLAAVGYGQFRPVADNSKAEGRRRNRRVNFVIKIPQ